MTPPKSRKEDFFLERSRSGSYAVIGCTKQVFEITTRSLVGLFSGAACNSLRSGSKQALLQENQICSTDQRSVRAYLIFLQQVLPELLEAAHIPPSFHHFIWYQNDLALSRYRIHVRQYKNETFG
ncbi:hypothetical protein TNCV_3260931 [Trichonephila clavipes]|nr:hypothetical protein TNCV_3260931 [Trichonephila clavipes]